MADNIYREILDQFGIGESTMEEIGAYADANFLVSSGNDKYILKEYKDSRGLHQRLEAESRVMQHLYTLDPVKFQKPLKTKNDEFIFLHEAKGIPKLYRVLGYLEGKFFAEAEHSDSLLESFGSFLAALDHKLSEVNETAISARQHHWDLQYFLMNEELIRYIEEPPRRKIVEHFSLQYKELVLPHLSSLRKSILHNDANEWNVLVKDEEICGIIDFGDLAYSALVHEPVIAITYAMLNSEDPVGVACTILKAYHEIFPLEKNEIDLMYHLMAARMCTSVVSSARGRILHPQNIHITISENPMWELLYQWISLNPVGVTNRLRESCGFPGKVVAANSDEIDRRNRFISRTYSLSYRKPIKMWGGVFQHMYDQEGNTYLDMRNNIPHVGHCHPRVVNAGQRQMARLNTNTRYLYDELVSYSERLLTKFPPRLSKVFLLNSGSAASDLAIRLAMNHSSHQNIAVMEHGYHGNTRMGIDISHFKYSGTGGKGKKDQIIQLPLPQMYRGKFEKHKDAGMLYAEEAKSQILQAGQEVSALIAEPVVGRGQIPLAQDYLKNLYPFIREQGGVCISDEVQTGFGRLGDYFWGFEMHGIIPDIVILGKPMGNGHPIGAVITTDEITRSFENGMEFFSSFGGNPVSCQIGEAVIDVIEEESLQENAAVMGKYLIQHLNQLKKQFPRIGDVRGMGLYLGVELVMDPGTRQPDTQLAHQVNEKLKERFILTGTDGSDNNVLILKPPLCFTRENADHFLQTFQTILGSLC